MYANVHPINGKQMDQCNEVDLWKSSQHELGGEVAPWPGAERHTWACLLYQVRVLLQQWHTATVTVQSCNASMLVGLDHRHVVAGQKEGVRQGRKRE